MMCGESRSSLLNLTHSPAPNPFDFKRSRSIMFDQFRFLFDFEQEGRTPLHLAILHGHLGVARLLVERGADEGFVDKAR